MPVLIVVRIMRIHSLKFDRPHIKKIQYILRLDYFEEGTLFVEFANYFGSGKCMGNNQLVAELSVQYL